MTPEEKRKEQIRERLKRDVRLERKLENIAYRYVGENGISPDEAYYENKRSIEVDDVLPILQWLSEDYCIVPKKKIAEWNGIIDDTLKEDHFIIEPAFRFMWMRLFEEGEL